MNTEKNKSIEDSLMSIKESLATISKSVEPKKKKLDYLILFLWIGFGFITFYLLYSVLQFINKL